MTIRLIVTPADSRYLIDHARDAYANKGDVIRETSTLRNAVAQFGRPKGAIVGSDIWITTIVIPPFGKAAVKAATSVPGGTIRAVGAVAATQTTGTFRVIGGTGKYAEGFAARSACATSTPTGAAVSACTGCNSRKPGAPRSAPPRPAGGSPDAPVGFDA